MVNFNTVVFIVSVYLNIIKIKRNPYFAATFYRPATMVLKVNLNIATTCDS